MNRKEKELVVSSIAENIASSEVTFVINYKGLNVKAMQDLRGKLREKNSSLKVTKARLMKKAIESLSSGEEHKTFSDMNQFFHNQVALVFSNEDAPVAAKVLVDFKKNEDNFDLVAGFFDGLVIDKNEVFEFALIPSKEILYGMLLAGLLSPVTNVVRILHAVLVKLLYLLIAVKELREKQVS